MLSIVIPVYNEQDNVLPLHERLTAALHDIGIDYEVILINDGSTDSTDANLRAIAAKDPRYKVVNFRRNFGQTAAMMAGFDFASGDIIIPLDGDLQNDPADIPRLLSKLAEGYDVVSGWRHEPPGWGSQTEFAVAGGELADLPHFGRPAARLRVLAQGIPQRRAHRREALR